MNKKTVLISLSILVVLVVGIFLTKGSNSPSVNKSEVPSVETKSSQSSAPISVIPADKIEVVHFHGTQQCWSCITVGNYALKTIKEKFPDEYATGREKLFLKILTVN